MSRLYIYTIIYVLLNQLVFAVYNIKHLVLRALVVQNVYLLMIFRRSPSIHTSRVEQCLSTFLFRKYEHVCDLFKKKTFRGARVVHSYSRRILENLQKIQFSDHATMQLVTYSYLNP